MGKKGQLTVFVIIGIVIIIVVGFAFAAKNWIETAQRNSQAQEILDDALHDDVLQNYVASCLERITQNGVQTILLQGGNLYDTPDQLGPIPFAGREPGIHYLPFNHSNQTYNVSYAIYPNTECSNVFLYPPTYPLPDTRMVNVPKFACSFSEPRYEDGYFGLHNLSRLCSSTGANQEVVDPDNIREVPETCAGLYMEIDTEMPMQTQLEYYIEQHLPACTNFTFFEERFADITLADIPKAAVTYGEYTMSAQVTYPFYIDVEGARVAKYVSFYSGLDINMKDMYKCAHELVKRDVRDIFFDKAAQFSQLGVCSRYEYYEYRNVASELFTGPFDDIIEIRDTNTLIRGEPLKFYFAVKNRRPALDLIRDDARILYRGISDIQVLENETIYLDPQGYDPDELNISYNYTMWQEDYIDHFNWSCCSPAGGVDCSTNLSQCMIRNYSVTPHEWTLSPRFITTKQNASYEPDRDDIGLHTVNVSIWDRENLIDFQEVYILVFDLPIAVINQTNLYDDVNDSYASIEDPFLLTGNASTKSTLASDGNLSNFIWEDILEFFVNNTYADLWLPMRPYIIDNNYTPEITTMNFSVVGKHNVSLIVVQNSTIGLLQSFPVTTNVTVLSCLPHEDPAAPWPYNLVNSPLYTPNNDPFQANHACCNGTDLKYGELVGSSNDCFNFEEYGQNHVFTDLPDQETITPYFVGGNPAISPLFTNLYTNDVIKREFVRQCTNDRGNTCKGAITEIRTIVDFCVETTKGDAETCAGPNKPVPDFDPAGAYCVDYSVGNSFQTVFSSVGFNKSNGEPANGTCSLGPRCASGPGTATFIPGGVYSCYAECDGAGGCLEATDCLCEAGRDYYGTSCGADTQCDGKPSGYAWSVTGGSGGKTEKGCSNACGYTDCSATHTAFNPSGKRCYTNPNQDDHKCDDGYVADKRSGSYGVAEPKCVSATSPGSHIENQDGQCEVALGSAAQCDEVAPDTCVPTATYPHAYCEGSCGWQSNRPIRCP